MISRSRCGITDYCKTASDDRIVRIWDWQSQTCIYVLNVHKDAVACASFHPKENLLVSASLGRFIRIWDVGVILQLSQMDTDNSCKAGHPFLGCFEGYYLGAKWASFHPTLRVVVYAEAWQIKIGRMEVLRFLICAIFGLSFYEIICLLKFHRELQKEGRTSFVSSSEDMSIRVWDATKGTFLHPFSREHDQLGILSAHHEISLLAAGHVNGMIVFKLERMWMGDHMSSMLFGKTASCGGVNTMREAKRGVGGSAMFVTQNRFAVLEKSSNQVLVKNLKNGIVKKCALPIATDAIFFAGTENLFYRAEDRFVIFDLQRRNVVGGLQTPAVRYVVWSQDMTFVALLSKHSIVIADTKLVISKFHVALYLGDMRERVKILENAGYLSLAYITATVHGLHDTADSIAVKLGD
ncbi:coatomer subunit alpha-3-like [Henckelia pumila]|uniref:coatomer subunit alpha-3-like n=1 Tax=Henckelia pumila TaxID=405737 RepID=UPI003C6E9016